MQLGDRAPEIRGGPAPVHSQLPLTRHARTLTEAGEGETDSKGPAQGWEGACPQQPSEKHTVHCEPGGGCRSGHGWGR